jgi:hypothetical protein
MKKFNWVVALGSIAVSVAMIGLWLMLLSSTALSTITRHSLVIFEEPPGSVWAFSTFLMLAGVTIMSIQVAAIGEHLFGKKK